MIGIVGAGLRGVYVMGARAAECGLKISALCDRLPARAREGSAYLESLQGAPVKVHIDHRALIADPEVELVWVTTPTYAHRDPAVAALKSGKRVYLDKPVAVTLEDSEAMLAAEARAGRPVIMGFTRRYERSWREAHRLVREGAIGELQMMLLRSVIPYTRYFHLWHRRQHRSGGAFNDKCSHHLDVFNWFAGSRCLGLSALGGRSGVIEPDPTAPKFCRDCERDCRFNIYKDAELAELGISELPPSWTEGDDEEARLDNCVYHGEIDIDDHMTVQLSYQNGIKASLFFSIFGPQAEDQETLELVGSRGRLRLERSSGLLDLAGDDRRVIDTRDPEFTSSHFGADLELMRELKRFVKGAPPVATLADGHQSLRMVRAALESGGKWVEL